MEENKGKNKGYDNLIPIKKGEKLNPNGRPKGQRNYATIYREALKKMAEAKGITPEEIEEQMEQVGLNKALKGDINFHKDIKDRIHGKALNKTDITTDGEKIAGFVVLPSKEIDNGD